MDIGKVNVVDEQRRSFPSIVLAVCAIGLCLFGPIIILVSQRPFLRLFEDMGVELSIVAQISLSPLLPMLLVALGMSGIIKEFVMPFRSIRDWWNAFILFSGGVAMVIYVAGMFSPLMSLIEGLS